MSYYYSHENLSSNVKGDHGAAPKIQFSELDIFSPTAVQGEIRSSFHERVYPIEGSLDESQPEIIFNIKPSSDLISLNDSFIVAEVKLLKKDTDKGIWVKPAASDLVTPANCVLYQLFKDQTIELNGKVRDNLEIVRLRNWRLRDRD